MNPTRNRPVALALTVVLVAGAGAGCGSSSSSSSSSPTAPPPAAAPASGPGSPGQVVTAETGTPGDIPDGQAYVPFTPPGAKFTVSVPEGWARTDRGGAITFTDKLNAIRIESHPAAQAPSPASVTAGVLPTVSASATGYTAGPNPVSTVNRKAGPAVLALYRADSPVDPVTGKVVNDDVERYAFWKNGTEVDLTLSGPVGADNVDPWKIVTDSFAWTA